MGIVSDLRAALRGGAVLFMAVAFGLAPMGAKAQELVLGAFLTLSGPGGDLGSQMKAGMEMAVDRMQQNFAVGGKPTKIRVIWYDDEGKGDVGLNVVTRALTVDHINVAVGFNSSDIVLRVMNEFQKARVPFITSAASSTGIGRKIAAEKMRYVFQLSPTANDLAPALVNAVLQTSKPKKVATIFFNIDSGRELTKLVKEGLAARSPDTRVVAEEFAALGASDFTSEFSKFKSLGVDTIFTDIYGSSAPIFFSQLSEMRVPALVASIGTSVSADSFITQHAKLMDGALVNVRWVPGNYTDLTKPMSEGYTKKTGFSPSPFAVQAFDSALIALDAVKQAGSLDPNAIASALESESFTGAWGVRRFTSLAQGHQMPIEAVIVQIQDGKKTVVYPGTAKAAGLDYRAVPPYAWQR